jgi:hypothetical protein
MNIPLIDIFDASGRLVQTTLVVPDENGSKKVTVEFTTPLGARAPYYLATVIESAAVKSYEEFFVIHDGHDGAQNTDIPITWIRDVAAAALKALPRTVGTLGVSVAFVRADPNCPF